MEQAQAELTAIGQRAAAAHPDTHERLRPVVLPYTREHLDLSHPSLVSALRIAQLLIGALSFVVAVNLAILIYACTVTRLGEIAVRTARLGAASSRSCSSKPWRCRLSERPPGWCWPVSLLAASRPWLSSRLVCSSARSCLVRYS